MYCRLNLIVLFIHVYELNILIYRLYCFAINFFIDKVNLTLFINISTEPNNNLDNSKYTVAPINVQLKTHHGIDKIQWTKRYICRQCSHFS